MAESAWPYPVPDDDGLAAHLSCGLRLPVIALPSTMGGAIDLSAVEGRSVVFVYPWTGRPGVADPPNWDHIPGAHGSTPQAIGFRDLLPSFAARGVGVFGLSSVSPEWQGEFAMRNALTYPLLSDEALLFAGAMRLPRFETGGMTFLKRLTLLCRNGSIEDAVYPVHPPDRHAADLLQRL
jgi:peroxiredoxin